MKTASEAQFRRMQQQQQQTIDTDLADNREQNIANNTSDDSIPSRILKDAFHVMQMMKVSLKPGMAKEFSTRFRDAIFVIDQEDYLISVDENWNTCMVENPAYISERVRRYIPPPRELHEAVLLVFEKKWQCTLY